MHNVLNLCWDLIYCKRSTVSSREGSHLWRMTSWLFSENKTQRPWERSRFHPLLTSPMLVLRHLLPPTSPLESLTAKTDQKIVCKLFHLSVSKDWYILLLCPVDASSCLTTSWSHSLGFSPNEMFCKHFLISARTEPLSATTGYSFWL